MSMMKPGEAQPKLRLAAVVLSRLRMSALEHSLHLLARSCRLVLY